jgi:hypothetical protein
LDLRAALEPPLDTVGLFGVIPELSLARELEGSPYHHLNTLDHVLEVVSGVERELEEGRIGASVGEDSVQGLRLAAQGPRLKPEHLRRHLDLCTWFLRVSRELGPCPEPEYAALQKALSCASGADVGYAASYLKLLVARGTDENSAVARLAAHHLPVEDPGGGRVESRRERSYSRGRRR